MAVAEDVRRDSIEAPSVREQADSETRRRENRPTGGWRHFPRSVEQLAVAEDVRRGNSADCGGTVPHCSAT